MQNNPRKSRVWASKTNKNSLFWLNLNFHHIWQKVEKFPKKFGFFWNFSTFCQIWWKFKFEFLFLFDAHTLDFLWLFCTFRKCAKKSKTLSFSHQKTRNSILVYFWIFPLENAQIYFKPLKFEIFFIFKKLKKIPKKSRVKRQKWIKTRRDTVKNVSMPVSATLQGCF